MERSELGKGLLVEIAPTRAVFGEICEYPPKALKNVFALDRQVYFWKSVLTKSSGTHAL